MNDPDGAPAPTLDPRTDPPLVDLASRALGGSVLYATDELFADRRNLIEPGPSRWDPDVYTADGKAYDGWETRRKVGRGEPGQVEQPDHAVLRLGAGGVVRSVVVDTAHFVGNYPPQASIEALATEGHPSAAELRAATWTTIAPRFDLAPDAATQAEVADDRRWTHVRLTIHPDGGVARLRVLGHVVPDPRLMTGTVDVAALANGALLLASSNSFYSSAANLLRPGVATTIAGGWETARRRGPGHEWFVVQLSGPTVPRLVEVDSSLFTGNAPGAVRVSGIDARAGDLADEGAWTELVPRVRVLPDTLHRYRVRDTAPGLGDGGQPAEVTHVRLEAFPDGGLNRFRLLGELSAAGHAELAARWAASLPQGHRRQVGPWLGEGELTPQALARLAR